MAAPAPTFNQDLDGLAVPGYASAAASDPIRLGWMQGAPPPADKIVRFGDGSSRQFPQIRWAFCHTRELIPTRGIARGPGPVWVLPRREGLAAAIDALRFTPVGAPRTLSWADSLAANYTDGIAVLHRGQIVYERYAGALTDAGQHIAMSVTKSFVGTLGAWLAHEGAFDTAKAVAHYVPELAASAFGRASVRQVMDMTTALRYSEDYTNPAAEIFDYVRAGGIVARPADYQGPEGFYAYLRTVQPEGTHGQGFMYKTVNSDVLGWVLHRTSGHDIPTLLQERLWMPLGMEHDASIGVDSLGTAFAGGGLATSLRDLARFGETLRCEGFGNGRQLIPPAAVADIVRGASPRDFEMAGYGGLPGWSYRNMWWITHNPHGAYMARGVHGQSIYIDPQAEMTIARYGSHPLASNVHNDAVTLPAFQALADWLIANH